MREPHPGGDREQEGQCRKQETGCLCVGEHPMYSAASADTVAVGTTSDGREMAPAAARIPTTSAVIPRSQRIPDAGIAARTTGPIEGPSLRARY